MAHLGGFRPRAVDGSKLAREVHLPLIPLEQAVPTAPAAKPNASGFLWRLGVPMAAYLALASYAAYQVASEGAAETAALALLAAVVLLPVAALGKRVTEVGMGAALVVAAAWMLPPGPVREAVVLATLAALVLLTSVRRLAVTLPELPLAVALPLALAAQALLRAEVLLPPQVGQLGLRLPVIVVALPAAAALAAVRLARRYGAGPALIAAGTALLLGPGWNVATTLALLALAAGDALADHTLAVRWRVAAALFLLVPLVWDPRAGAIAAGAGLALAAGRWAPLAAALVAVPLATVFALRAPAEAFALWLWLPLLVPAALVPARAGRGTALAALLLAAGAAAGGPALSALAAPLALAALSLRARTAAALDMAGDRAGGRERLLAAPHAAGATRRAELGAPLAAQGAWTVPLLAGAALLAAPPWLRAEPLPAALGLLGLSPSVPAALAVVAVWFLLGPALECALRGRLGAGWTTGAAASAAAGAVLLATLLLRLPPAGIAPLTTDVALSATAPAWEALLTPGDGLPNLREAAGSAPPPAAVSHGAEPASVRTVVLDSTLANSAALAPGRAVATVRLLDRAGRQTAWTLRAGRETDEWAAGRPDLAAQLGARAPAPWLSWVVGDFLARRYRARWDLAGATPLARVRVERRADLPPEVVVAIHYLELRP